MHATPPSDSEVEVALSEEDETAVPSKGTSVNDDGRSREMSEGEK